MRALTIRQPAIISKASVAPEAWNTGSVGDAVLAAKVPELCQTCDGRGRLLGDEYEPDGNCPDCPTIARLLAIGAAVLDDRNTDRLPRESPQWYNPANASGWAAGWTSAVRHLRAVQP